MVAISLRDVEPYVEARRDAIDGVVFDAVGTLIRPVAPVASTYHGFGREYGSQLTPDQIAERFHAAFRKAIWQPATNEQHRSAWRSIVAEVFHDVQDGRDALFESLWHHYSQPTSWSVCQGTVELLQTLQRRGKLIAIASNFDDRLHGICADFPDLSPCRPVLTATTFGVAKPAVEFFRAVAMRLDRDPRRLLMVGDDAELDIAAARKAGWQAFQVPAAAWR